ncbi:hypothetical protein GGR57DRAFT_394732 [Xylariaceae sp. FL1272]|nr:hypothetical protein GGR57DRAFT_394732 [Xylariaceae sp. FL1272]
MKEKNSRPDRITSKTGGKKPPKPTSKNSGKNTQASASRANAPTSQKSEPKETPEERKRQEKLLDIFRLTFRDVLDDEKTFASRLQDLKTALFNRDFAGAFGREEALDVYAARWSPTRALGYAKILRGIDQHLKALVGSDFDAGEISARVAALDLRSDEATDLSQDAERTIIKPLKVLAIGGAAAEIVAIADYISTSYTHTGAEITLLDVGPWGPVVEKLRDTLTTPPPLSKFASAAAQEANKALVQPETFGAEFVQKDVLSLDQRGLEVLLRSSTESKSSGTDIPPTDSTSPHSTSQTSTSPLLITILFTLNELYTISGIKATTSFLRLLTSLVPAGTLLLVVDSPGSYSEAAVGKEAKKYPMQWLLHHTLMPAPRKRASTSKSEGKDQGEDGEEERISKEEEKEEAYKWERLETHDSVWFRVAEGLRYPIPLENMRYQMHLYRALG